MSKLENLQIAPEKGKYSTPSILFNAETGVCEISGESYLEDIVDFYVPLKEWLQRYMDEVKEAITFNIKLTYVNSGSSKIILGLLMMLKEYQKNGGNISINWHYKKEDEEMYDEAQDFMYESGLEFNLVAE